MKFLVTLMLTFTYYLGFSQKITFNKSTMKVDEPYKKGTVKKDTFNIELTAENIPSPNAISVEVQKSNESTYPDSLVTIITNKIAPLKAKNVIQVSVSSNLGGIEDQYVLLAANWVASNGEKKQVRDTLFIKNIFPLSEITKKDDSTEWNDGKRAELFIGTNFDFINSKVTLSDWYGGARVFLPSITDVRFNNNTSNRVPRWGFAAGIYHAKSLSNFGNSVIHDSTRGVYGRVTNYIADTAFVRYDTINTRTTTELNNWGIYFAPLFQYSHYENAEKFVTNMYVGAHLEVIRRTIVTNYSFDTVGYTTTKYTLGGRGLPRSASKSLPQNTVQNLYDAYFGICAPIQFLWKGILDMKINPCLGFGSRGYSTQVTRGDLIIKKSPFFYLVQFDLLAHLGGLSLNIGGEVRGYFPNENPIMAAYLGTSFSIQKLADFVSK